MSFKETYNIDAKQAEAALKALSEAQKRLAENADGATKKLSAEDKAARRLAEAADPMKKFNRQLEETATLVGKGKVSVDDAAVSVGKWQQRLDGASKAQEAAFGARAISSLASYAAGFMSVGTVLSGVNMLLDDMKENAKGAAKSIRDSLESVGELQQISDFAENMGFVREMRKRGVVADDKTGAALASGLVQAGFTEKEREFIAYDLVGTKFLPAGEAADVATQIGKARDALRIKELEDAFQKITHAGGATSATNPQVASALTSYAAQFMDLGFGADQTLAAIIPADKASKNIAIAAERLKSFADQVAKNGLAKDGLIPTINAIGDMERSGKNLYKILGESNAVAVYRMFDEEHEQKAYLEQVRLVASAPERDVLGQQIGAMMKDPPLASAWHAERADRQLKYGREQRLGTLQNNFESARDYVTNYFEGKGNYAGAYFNRTVAWTAETTGDQRVFLKDALREEQHREKVFGDSGAFSKEFERDVLAFLERTATASERTSQSVEGGTRANAE